jgi:hypothetical protein
MRFEPLALSRPQTHLRRAPLSLMLVLLSGLGVARAADPQADQWNSYLDYKSYRLRLTWTAADSWTKQEKQGDCTTISSLSASLQAEVSLKLVRSERGHGIHALWTLEKGAKPEGSLTFSLSQHQHSSCKGRPDSDSKSSQQGGGVTGGDGRFELNLKTGEYRIFGFATTTNARVTQEFEGGPSSNTQGGLTLYSTPDGVPGLPQDITGTATPGGNTLEADQPIELVPGAAGDVIGAACRQPARFFWRLEPWEQDQDEMIFDDSDEYKQWIPAARPEDMPGITLDPSEPAWQPLTVTVRIVTKKDGNTGRSGKIRFTLEDVSRSKGFCLNFPQGGLEKADLRFSDKQLPGITVTSSQADKADVAETTYAVSVATVRLESRDPGAYGTLKATCGDLNLKAMYKPTNTYALAIPRDDDGNHVADAWEKKKALPHHDQDWDGEVVAGQKKDGDGVTFYNEYRGLVLLDGKTRAWKRLDPNQKEVFILDPDGSFPIDAWKRLAKMQVNRVEDAFVDATANGPNSPLVDFNASDKASHPFYAIRVLTIHGDLDPDPKGGHHPTTVDPSFPEMAYADHPGDGIKGTVSLKVFPDRAAIFVDYYIRWCQTALDHPLSPEAAYFQNPLLAFTKQEAGVAMQTLRTQQGYWDVVRKVRNVLYLHETGHIVGNLDDFNPGDPAGDTHQSSCLMRYRGLPGLRNMVIASALGKGDPDLAFPYVGFCPECGSKLSPKDW